MTLSYRSAQEPEVENSDKETEVAEIAVCQIALERGTECAGGNLTRYEGPPFTESD